VTTRTRNRMSHDGITSGNLTANEAKLGNLVHRR
jgi:hypothetical protein